MTYRDLTTLLGGTSAENTDTPGEPAGTRFIGTGEDATTAIANRPHRALAENCDDIKAAIDPEHTFATGAHTNITPDTIVTKVANGVLKLDIEAGATDNDQVQLQVKANGGSPVFTVDEDGDILLTSALFAKQNGTKIFTSAGAGDNDTAQVSVRDNSDVPVFTVDEDGDVAAVTYGYISTKAVTYGIGPDQAIPDTNWTITIHAPNSSTDDDIATTTDNAVLAFSLDRVPEGATITDIDIHWKGVTAGTTPNQLSAALIQQAVGSPSRTALVGPTTFNLATGGARQTDALLNAGSQLIDRSASAFMVVMETLQTNPDTVQVYGITIVYRVLEAGN